MQKGLNFIIHSCLFVQTEIDLCILLRIENLILINPKLIIEADVGFEPTHPYGVSGL